MSAVVVVGGASSPLVQALVGAMTREALHVQPATADILREVPRACVHVFLFDASIALAFADPIATWARTGTGRVGLIAIIEDGAGTEREALLAAGFDDVATGAPSLREVVARVRALQRRLRAGGPPERLRFGTFMLDLREHTLWTDATAVHLTTVELAVMRELVKAQGRPLSRLDLLELAWRDPELETTERAVDNVILRLRRKLPRPDALQTVRGVGFRLVSRSGR